MDILGLTTWRDVLGAAGSFLLLLPPLMDQVSRYRLSNWRKAADGAPAPLAKVSETAIGTAERRASKWKPWESFSMAVGAFFLMLSFWFPSS